MIDQLYYLDNSGYWDTRFEWAFADTMLSTEFVGFTTTVSTWKNTLAPALFQQYENWNTKWATQPVVANLLSMVTAEADVGGSSSSLLLARVVADPKILMGSSYRVAVAVNRDLEPNGAIPLTYNDNGDTFFLSALLSAWQQKLPKFKFLQLAGDDDIFNIGES